MASPFPSVVKFPGQSHAASRATTSRGEHVKITAAVLREINKGYSIEELELDPPKAGEALVKYAYAGYCHSDLSNSKGFTKMKLPMVAGHEASGVVMEVGPGVTKVKPGDHVASAWMCPCGECPECRKGMGNICSGTFQQFVNGTMLDHTSRLRDSKGNTVLHGNFVSGFSDYTVMPEGALISVPKNMPLDWAALMSCCVPTGWGTVTKKANVQPGDAVAVWGMGGVGQNILRAAKPAPGQPAHRRRPRGGPAREGHEAGRHPLHQQLERRPGADHPGAHRRWPEHHLRVQRRPGRDGPGLLGSAPERQADAGGHHGRARSGAAGAHVPASSGRSPSSAASTAPSPPGTTSRSTSSWP